MTTRNIGERFLRLAFVVELDDFAEGPGDLGGKIKSRIFFIWKCDSEAWSRFRLELD